MSTPQFTAADKAAWREAIRAYRKPSTPRAVWQMVNTFVPYALLWYLMYLSLAVSWWLTVPLALLAGLFLVRFRRLRQLRCERGRRRRG